jgi:hypothetical protein
MSRKGKTANISLLSNSRVSHSTTLAIIATVVAIFVAIYFTSSLSQSNPSSSPATSSPHPTETKISSIPSREKDSPEGIPAYDEYILLAQQNKWSPTDPVMKLMQISHQWSQLINLQNMSQTYEVIKLMNYELQFLTQVFMKSNDHLIDLTSIFHDSLEGIHRSIYHLEKQILQYQQRERSETLSHLSFLLSWVFVFPHASLELSREQKRSITPNNIFTISLRFQSSLCLASPHFTPLSPSVATPEAGQEVQ